MKRINLKVQYCGSDGNRAPGEHVVTDAVARALVDLREAEIIGNVSAKEAAKLEIAERDDDELEVDDEPTEDTREVRHRRKRGGRKVSGRR